VVAFAADARRVPTIDDLLNIKSVGGTQISPDGKWVAYTVSYSDFKQDAFVTQIWLVESDSGRKFQLTRGDKSATTPRWSPDGQWLAFLSNRIEDKNQIFVINPLGGEAQQLTKSETAIGNFAWSEDGKTIAYTATEPTAQMLKDRKDYLGDYDVVREGYGYVHLWTINVADAMNAPMTGRQRTKKKDFSVDSFSWSPDGASIVFSATLNPDLIQGVTSDIYLLKLSDDSVKKIVNQPGPDNNPRFSPDGKQIVFSSAMAKSFSLPATQGLRLSASMAARRDRSPTRSTRIRVWWNGKPTGFILPDCKKPLRICSASTRRRAGSLACLFRIVSWPDRFR